MKGIIERIQQEILDPAVSLNSILLKAKVLAYQLKNEDLKHWVRSELDGYGDNTVIPNYRIVETHSLGFIANRYDGWKNLPIANSSVPEFLEEAVSQIKFHHGIKSIEEMATEDHVTFVWPHEWVQIWNSYNRPKLGNFSLMQATRSLGRHVFVQILDTVRSKLQDFILELSDLPWNMDKEPPPADQIE